MRVPNISDYKNAIVIPESFATLGNLRPENGFLGDIYFSSGNFAVVFKMRDVQTGKLYAVKCFTREQERRTESLDDISRYLETLRSPYIVPYTFLKDEIWVNDADYPVLLMDWVDGVTLGEKVKALCAARNTEGLHRLTVAFAEMALSLLEQDWAHSDLKHDNIMVRPDDSLALVDYDGCFVPSMSGQNAREIGSPCYRHPKRTAQHFDRHIDDFSILVIFLSLRALSQNPDLFESHQNGENLLFSVADLAEPQGSVLLGQLRRSADTYMQGTVGLLEFSVAMGSMSVFGLRDGVLRVFFEGFKGDLLPKKVILRCKNIDGKEVVFEVNRDVTSLYLIEKRLVSVSTEIGQLTNLTKLSLGSNRLTSLPAEIGRLTNLTSLNLFSNELTSLPAEMGCLTNLAELNLWSNELTSLPAEIWQLTTLTTLNLRRNQLKSLPAEIGCLTNLAKLNLGSNQLINLPLEIGKLSKLTELDISENRFISLPIEIGKLPKLTQSSFELGLIGTKTTNIWDGGDEIEVTIKVDKYAQSLDLSGKWLSSLSGIEQLTNLRSLDITDNGFDNLSGIEQLTNLRSLTITIVQFQNSLFQIQQLTVLKELKLDCSRSNNLRNSLVEIAQIKSLTSLHFKNLPYLPPEIGLLNNLTELNLGLNSYIAITTLPIEILKLTNLKKINLSGRLKDLPSGIGQLKNLTHLNLRGLKNLHSEIWQLANLEYLDLSYSYLTNLPDEIGQLSNLTDLDLNSNQLTSDEKEKIKRLLPNCVIKF